MIVKVDGEYSVRCTECGVEEECDDLEDAEYVESATYHGLCDRCHTRERIMRESASKLLVTRLASELLADRGSDGELLPGKDY